MAFQPNPIKDDSESPTNLDVAKLHAGVIGKLFGTGSNGPVNIAGLCVILGFATGLIISAVLVFSGHQNPYEIWKYVSPIITGALGFIFGKGSQ